MLYHVLRSIAAIALRWYYADVAFQGVDRVPPKGPLLLVANHPNALIDPLLVGTAMQRRVLLTAKATLFEARLLAIVLKAVGVVPLRRAKDEVRADVSTSTDVPTRDRNAEAFRLVTAALAQGQAILVFPEGISHDDPSIAPLKSGAARMALQARTEGALGLRILPIGLIYEAKERPNSRVLVRVGEPLSLDEWVMSMPSSDATRLTAELDARLRAVTLNFATSEQAERAVELARALVTIAAAPVAVAAPRSLDAEADVTRCIDAAISELTSAPPAVIESADALTKRLRTIERELGERGVALQDIRISQRLSPGARFTAREAIWSVLALAAGILGGLTHWIPLRLARQVALASLQSDGSRDQPAMRTILFGIGSLLVWYGGIFFFLARWQGWGWAIAGILGLFMAADAHRRLQGRFHRAIRRARSYLALRRDPGLQGRVLAEFDALLSDAVDLERRLIRPK